MPTNSYFQQHDHFGQQGLLEDLVIESIKVTGFDLVYLPRTYVNLDELFGEDTISSFGSHYCLEMYLESVDGFEGEQDFISKFGLEIRQSARFVCSKKRFKSVITNEHSDILHPREGDLLYFPLTQSLFIIKYVGHENPFYQLGKRYVYTLDVEHFIYSQETLDTDYNPVDDIATALNNNNDVTNEDVAINTDIETEADGSADDAYSDTGTDDRGTGVVNFDETNPFGSY